jgi:hypothetical protein
MKTKQLSAPIGAGSSVERRGITSSHKARKVVDELLSELFGNEKIDCRLASSDEELTFVFMVAGTCATIQVRDISLQEGGAS